MLTRTFYARTGAPRASVIVAASLCLSLALAACGPRYPETPLAGGQPIPDTGAPLPSVGATTGTTGGAAGTTAGRARPSATRPTSGPGIRGGGSVVRGDVIKVGGLFPLSGGLSTLGKEAFQGAQAYFNHLNATGGIRGKRIDFIECDDQADDTRSTTCAKRLVEQENAFIMGPSFTPFSMTVIGQLERGGVPWIGYDGINVEGFDAANVVTVGAPIDSMAHALLPYWYADVERRTGAAPERIGAVVLDAAPSKAYVKEAREVICPSLGCTVSSADTHIINYTTTEYATICRNLQAKRVDAVWIVTDPASAIKLLVQCQAIGYKPPKGFLGQHGIYMDLTLKQAGSYANGMYANGAVLPESVSGAATDDMKRVIRRYYPDASFGYFTSLAYASARMTADLIEHVLAKGEALTRANVLAAAREIGTYSCHGLCKGVSLAPPAGRSGGNHQVWIVRADFSSAEPRWVYQAGPFDAFRATTWPCPGKPRPC